MYFEITSQHPANPKKLVHVCNYGYFLAKGKWELICINLFGKCISIFRKKRYRLEWPVKCN